MFSLQMFIIRWIYAFSDYLSEVIDDILHNNWFVDMFFLSFGGMVCWLFHWHIFGGLQAWDDASSISYLLCSVHLVWNCGHPGLQVRSCSCIKLVVFFCTDISLCISFGGKQINIFFVFVATPARITRLKRKQKMGRGQKMGHQELAVLQGKNAEFISTWNKSRIDHHMSSLLLFNCYFLAEVPGRTLWRWQSWRISRTWATW